MDVNTFAAIAALTSAAVTFTGAVLFLRWASTGAQGDVHAQVTLLFPIGHC